MRTALTAVLLCSAAFLGSAGPAFADDGPVGTVTEHAGDVLGSGHHLLEDLNTDDVVSRVLSGGE